MTSETKTFIPQTPVDFSSSLLAQLDSSNESNYTRQQYAETYIQQKVNAELKKIESDKLAKLDETLKNSLKKISSANSNSSISVGSINEKLDKINEQLVKLNSLKPVKSAELKAAESKVSACLKLNKDTPLNCWEEVEKFKNLTKSL
ncbi:unnamed protein product [[Candida] boidinii]|uniref:Unnamed protein product n=1 Tax=Candida boidinii TaxID=5477 RepID=A0A9W6SU99_CANBO|nr:hypothetical protein B5S30_g201 [[Candida] boidinii]OWB81468.1 hypothetical protein B5S33_g85 [[Candida] boidinii]GME66924.1 unnamed protein product [[Candida] boidinii]GMF61628.1 unnamed protein product [[Candida] boidinii]GMF98359.1 unnamed protein product [[Candida] boidinii]